MVTCKNMKSFNLSKASNILRQVNSKVGGDLFSMSLATLAKRRPMLVGIDVCHEGA